MPRNIDQYEKTQETLALLKILALGNRQVAEGKITKADQVFAKLYRQKNRG